MSEVIDSTTGEVLPAEIVPHAGAMTLFGSDNPKEALARMREHADALAEIIEAKKLYIEIKDKKTGKVKKHVVIEGWTLLGSLVGVFPPTESCEPILSTSGELLGFKATVEAVTKSGQVVGRAVAFCMKSETRGPWAYADDYALASMSQTRAASKALRMPLGFIMQLAGYETLPADEVPPGGFHEPQGSSRSEAAQPVAPEAPPAPKSPPAAQVDAKGRPVISDGSEYLECPSCFGGKARIGTVRVNPNTGDAYCWKRANGCGATWTKTVWDMVDPNSTSLPTTPVVPEPAGRIAGSDEPPMLGDEDMPF